MIRLGTFRCKAVDGRVAQHTNEQTGEQKPVVYVLLEFTHGVNLGQRARWQGWLTDAAGEATMRQLECLGVDITQDITALVGLGTKEALVEVEGEPTVIAGRQITVPRATWIKMLPSLAGVEAHPNAGEANAIAAKFAAKHQRTQEERRSRGRTNGAAGGAHDDDVDAFPS